MLPIVLALAVAGCGAAGAEEKGTGEVDAVCAIVQREVPLPGGVEESSGMVASRRVAGLFWTHNDSGRDPVIFAVDAGGRLRGRFRVTGARNRDWEDAAMGPCPGGGDCLYLADIGNNRGGGREVSLWRVPEPRPGEAAEATAPAERFTARWPQGSPDAEALFVLPDGAVYVVTKGNRDPVELYRWPTPLAPGDSAVLQRVRQLAPVPRQPGDRVTGASASPDGRWVAIRTYSTLVFYRTAELLAGRPPAAQMDLTPLAEGQGEAVSLGDDGTVVLTSEGGGRHFPSSLTRLACRLP